MIALFYVQIIKAARCGRGGDDGLRGAPHRYLGRDGDRDGGGASASACPPRAPPWAPARAPGGRAGRGGGDRSRHGARRSTSHVTFTPGGQPLLSFSVAASHYQGSSEQ